jgi:hypothetical protein
MWPAMARQSATSKRSSAWEAADVAAACIRAGMSVSSTSAFPSSILFPAGLLPSPGSWLVSLILGTNAGDGERVGESRMDEEGEEVDGTALILVPGLQESAIFMRNLIFFKAKGNLIWSLYFFLATSKVFCTGAGTLDLLL